MFNKPSWNNKKGGYLKPPDKEQEERRIGLLDRMKATLSQKKQEASPIIEKIPLSEIAQQKHYNLDASIEEEIQKRTPVIPPISKFKLHPIIIPVETESVEEVAEEIEEATEDVLSIGLKTFNPPDPAETDISDLIEALKIVEKYLANAKNELLFLGDSIHDTDYETSDFLHSMELSSLSDEEKIALINKLTEVRQRRRSYKMRQEFFKDIEAFVDRNENIANKLGTLRGQLAKIQEKQRTAQYFTKIRTDIKQDKRVHIGSKAMGQK